MMSMCAARRGYVLLEVLVSLVLLGIGVAGLMRSFTLSINAIRRNDVATQAQVLAESILQNLELEKPTSRVTEGNFEESGYPFFSYKLEYEKEELEYRYLKTVNKIENLKSLHYAKLTIEYDNKQNKKFTPIVVELYLPPIERFNYASKRLNELFREEEEE